MKTVICALLVAATALAEPPRYRSQRQSLDRESTTPAGEDAPYPAAGYRPSVAFDLPNESAPPAPVDSYAAPQQGYGAPQQSFPAPQQSYGAPQQSYGAPQQSYGAPQQNFGAPQSYDAPQQSYGAPQQSGAVPQSEYGAPGTERAADDEGLLVEGLQRDELKQAPADAEVLSSQGAYYVLLPDSRLQRVQYRTENDLTNMAYTARVQYSSGERAPLYVYSAQPLRQSAAYVQLL